MPLNPTNPFEFDRTIDAERFESTELLSRVLLSGATRALTGPVEKIGALAAEQKFF